MSTNFESRKATMNAVSMREWNIAKEAARDLFNVMYFTFGLKEATFSATFGVKEDGIGYDACYAIKGMVIIPLTWGV